MVPHRALDQKIWSLKAVEKGKTVADFQTLVAVFQFIFTLIALDHRGKTPGIYSRPNDRWNQVACLWKCFTGSQMSRGSTFLEGHSTSRFLRQILMMLNGWNACKANNDHVLNYAAICPGWLIWGTWPHLVINLNLWKGQVARNRPEPSFARSLPYAFVKLVHKDKHHW